MYMNNFYWSISDEMKHIKSLGTAKKKSDDPEVTRALHIKRLKGYILGLANRVRWDHLDAEVLLACASQELRKLKGES